MNGPQQGEGGQNPAPDNVSRVTSVFNGHSVKAPSDMRNLFVVPQQHSVRIL